MPEYVRTGIIIISIAISVPLLVIVVVWTRLKKLVESEAELSAYISQYGDEEIKVYKRGNILSLALKIVDDKDAVVAYKPKELHYNAVSGGGVTVGSVYTTGGYNYLAGTYKNGKCRIEYNNKMIRKIHLSDELIEKAKESEIAKYMDKNNAIMVIDHVELSDIEMQIVLSNLKTTSYLFGGEALTRGYPSLEKCTEIMNWLCAQ